MKKKKHFFSVSGRGKKRGMNITSVNPRRVSRATKEVIEEKKVNDSLLANLHCVLRGERGNA
jgi:hypothetical protein